MKNVEEQKYCLVPDQDTLLKNLIKIDNNNLLQKEFYPLLFKMAGQYIKPYQLVIMIQMAILDYRDKTKKVAKMHKERIPEFISAFILDNKNAIKEANDFWKIGTESIKK